MTGCLHRRKPIGFKENIVLLVHLLLVYLVTAFVPSLTACFATSPGRSSRTAVWISRELIVDFLQYFFRRYASIAMRSKMSLTKEFVIPMALVVIPVSWWPCFNTLWMYSEWLSFLFTFFFFLSAATPDFNVPAFFSVVTSREGLCDFAMTLQRFPLCYTSLFDSLRTLESHCNIASLQHKTGSGANFRGMHWRCIIFQLEIKILVLWLFTSGSWNPKITRST